MGKKSVVISDRTFEQEVLEAPTPVVVDFWANWCPPCKMIAPVLEEIATEKDGALKVAKIDSDENPATVQKFGVMSLPTLLIFRMGKRSLGLSATAIRASFSNRSNARCK